MAALNFPASPSNDQTFEGTNGADYTYDAIDNSWTGQLDLSSDINPVSIDINATPNFVSGTGTNTDPFVITPRTVARNGSTKSLQYIKITNQTPGKLVRFANSTVPASSAEKINQPINVVNANGIWEGFLVYSDSEGMTTTSGSTVEGLLHIGSVYFTWTITQTA